NLALAYCMLCGWRMRLPRILDVWHKRTVAHRPDVRPIGNSQELVHEYSASFLCAREREDEGTGHGSGRPHQSAGWNCDTHGERSADLRRGALPCVTPDSYTAAPEPLLPKSSQRY